MTYSLSKVWVSCPFCLSKWNIRVTGYQEKICGCGAKVVIEIDTSIRLQWHTAKNVLLEHNRKNNAMQAKNEPEIMILPRMLCNGCHRILYSLTRDATKVVCGYSECPEYMKVYQVKPITVKAVDTGERLNPYQDNSLQQ